MTNGGEVGKALYRAIVEIADREKKKDDYGRALIAGVVEGLFKDAAKSIQE